MLFRHWQSPWILLFSVSIGTLMATLDASSVTIALPSIARDFGVGIPMVSWVSLAYFLTISVLLLPLGRLADLHHRGRLYATSMLLFGLGSGLCAMAPSLGWLIGFRAVEALGAAGIMANSPALVAGSFPGGQRGRALGLVTLIATIGSTAGPTIGGLLTGHFGWRAVFLLNLPIGLLGAWNAWRVMARLDQSEPTVRRFDLRGSVLSGGSLACLIIGLMQRELLGTQTSLSLVCAAIIGLVVFLREERYHSSPLLDLALFRIRAFASATGSSFLAFSSRMGVFLLLPFLLERTHGLRTGQVGVIMASFPLAVMSISPFTGALSDRLGSRGLAVTGLLVSSAALLALAEVGPDGSRLQVVVALVTLGAGAALFTPPNNNAMLSSVSSSHLGLASGILAVVRNLGIVIGMALAGLISGGDPGNLEQGFRHALWAAAGLSAMGAAVAALRPGGARKENS